MKPELAIVALGSNLGDSQNIIRRAMDELQKFSVAPVIKSSLWRTPPLDCPPGSRDFVNAIAGLVPLPGETSESLLEKFQAMEKEFGRQTKITMNEPRPLDLDLIAFGQETRNTGKLILPHPRVHLRRFVLQPLSEVAPDLVLPGQVKTVAQLLATLPPESGMAKMD
jgi:2-amino-4-hydroxy-6-hydroxymethyldihydropteridine diphosphokinase